MNWEIKNPLIYKRSLYHKKHPVSFRTQNLPISLEKAHIEGSWPKWQLVECVTLWSNSVDKHCLYRLPHRIHLCILAHSSSERLLTPRSSPPRSAIRELRSPSRWLSSIGFRIIGWRTEELGSDEEYWEAPSVSLSLSHTHTHTHTNTHTHTHTHSLKYMVSESTVILLYVYNMYIEYYCSVGLFGAKFIFILIHLYF